MHSRALFVAAALAAASPSFAAGPMGAEWAIAIHGGAGVISRTGISAEDDKAIRAALAEALDAGAQILKSGGSSTDAVVAAVSRLETSPWFNAGIGAVLTSAGTVELDAAIMDGASQGAGAVTGVTTTLSPIALARTLMDKGPHVFLAGPATDAYARTHQLTQVPNSHFVTERRLKQLQDLRQRNQGASLSLPAELRMGTVGAVARDVNGNLAAGTSTGGLTGKSPGRVGDAPVIGAGTLADNRCLALSATGSGEMFIRARVASQICDRSRFGGQPLQQAADEVLAEVKAMGGDGGVILLPPKGEPLFAFNSAGMYRGRASGSGLHEIKVYGDE
ncbi:isoaspartyl peptidase/L-asparaginase [Sandaracinobacter sp. RS1-74]|uniref:isoaspartyl peptidase/L-asparaginase family protein n=1 Tax=Sandaracinobacteroides sayramensis TaxID=2913411 RepID=UPI001EDAFE58|nr:isoaspartyl peptidase/L-asparaginase [Sandaracinobacteroides sayramensis]MCG2842816.1 isoaspartyl peptidase/L-asparaginase [Sandaracinobacteroides sayramensis]